MEYAFAFVGACIMTAGIVCLVISLVFFKNAKSERQSLRIEENRLIEKRRKANHEFDQSRMEHEGRLARIREQIANEVALEQQKIEHLQALQRHLREEMAVERERHAKKLEAERKLQERALATERKRNEKEIAERRSAFQQEIDAVEILKSNLLALPYMAGIIADFETHGLELLAQSLDWGSSQERLKKVLSIREIRKETAAAIAQSKEAQYQLEYAIRMFPGLEDFLETDYRELHEMNLSDVDAENHDRTRNYLSREEYSRLSATERNQLALDRYRNSHRKTNWQIGRDYENYVGYLYSRKGYAVEYFGSEKGLEDLGRDLIAKKDGITLIIQCKYWSSKKEIHEKHINQLYGTMVCYCLENDLPTEQVHGVLVTNITLSGTARRFAKFLGIEAVERLPVGEYPCIKCNINRDEYGSQTRIYHLPFDQQYDTCKIDAPGEFFAMTVAEAEAAGFRRAFRWHDT